MWLLKQARCLELQFSFKFLLFLWIFTQYNKANGNPSAATVTKARCYANCLTKVSQLFNILPTSEFLNVLYFRFQRFFVNFKAISYLVLTRDCV